MLGGQLGGELGGEHAGDRPRWMLEEQCIGTWEEEDSSVRARPPAAQVIHSGGQRPSEATSPTTSSGREHDFVSVRPQCKKFALLKKHFGPKRVQGPVRPHRQKHSQAESSFREAVLQKAYGAKKHIC